MTIRFVEFAKKPVSVVKCRTNTAVEFTDRSPPKVGTLSLSAGKVYFPLINGISLLNQGMDKCGLFYMLKLHALNALA